jgi:hypothetical protein
VQALVWDYLGSRADNLPPQVAAALATDAKHIATSNLASALVSKSLLSCFRAAGVPLLFLKGLTLAALSYRTPFLKMGWDIDVLVPEHMVDRGAELLAEQGYTLVTPAGEVRPLSRWHARHKESTWRKHDIYVELHSRLTDNRAILAGLNVRASAQDVPVATGITLPTLGNDDLFAYLAVHGASSAWFRLKWICDFAAFIAPFGPAELDRLYAHAARAGAGRAPGQALLLADRLFGSLKGSPLKEVLARDRLNCWLAETAYKQMTARLALREPTETPLGTAMIHLTQFALLPGLSFKFSELRRQVRSSVDNLRA